MNAKTWVANNHEKPHHDANRMTLWVENLLNSFVINSLYPITG